MSGKWACVLADPPWKLSGGKNGRGGWSKTVSPDAHYRLMKTEEIAALPVGEQLAAPDAHLWLWVPNCMLPDGLLVMAAWGFRYSNHLAWFKTGAPGLGQRIRTRHEVCLLGLRGRIPYARDPETGRRRQVPSAFHAPRGRHSAKPEEVRRMIEVVSPGPRIELFARGSVPDGWDCWGDQCESSIVFPSVVG